MWVRKKYFYIIKEDYTVLNIGSILQNKEECFFGYYDKTPWSSDMKFVLFNKIINNEIIAICLYNTNDQLIREIGFSKAWNLQQGCMAQWILYKGEECVIYNDIEDKHLISKISTINGVLIKKILFPIQALNPTNKSYISLNYSRLFAIRPEYGYKVSVLNFKANEQHDKDGLWEYNIETDQVNLIISLNDLIDRNDLSMKDSLHKYNHVFYSPNGEKLVFLHRWQNKHGKYSRLYLYDRILHKHELIFANRIISHYFWKDNETIIIYSGGKNGINYYLINVNDKTMVPYYKGYLDKYGDGHPSYSNDRKWIVTDSYPDRKRIRHILLFDIQKEKMIEVGGFFEPKSFEGSNRCDLHPRWSPDGNYIAIDSAYSGMRTLLLLNTNNVLLKEY